jgi:hypothetical protein
VTEVEIRRPHVSEMISRKSMVPVVNMEVPHRVGKDMADLISVHVNMNLRMRMVVNNQVTF